MTPSDEMDVLSVEEEEEEEDDDDDDGLMPWEAAAKSVVAGYLKRVYWLIEPSRAVVVDEEFDPELWDGTEITLACYGTDYNSVYALAQSIYEDALFAWDGEVPYDEGEQVFEFDVYDCMQFIEDLACEELRRLGWVKAKPG